MSTATIAARAGPASVRAQQRAQASRPAARKAHTAASPKALRRSVVVQASAVDEDKAMRQAQERWQDNIRQGKVRNVTSKDLKAMVESGWTVLDVRPEEETEVVGVKGAVEVPLFQVDDSMDPGSLLKQMSAFGMGGWWEGSAHMKANEAFMAEVQAKIPKDAKVIVTCQKGLRSLAACEQLARAGYGELAWVSGGLDTVRPGDIATTVEKDLRYSGIGGLSSVVGWTEVQQEENKDKDGSFGFVLKIAGALLVLDLAVFAVEEVQYLTGQ